MRRLKQTGLIVLAGLVVTLTLGEMSPVQCTELGSFAPSRTAHLPIFIDHKGEARELERPAVPFEHDRHTTALKQSKSQDCTVCHVLKETDRRLANPEVKVFRFPKGIVDETDKTSIMYAYHNECVSCHRKKASEGAKTGPDIGLCGSCHKRKPQVQKVTWAWSPIFNYARHARHLEAAKKFGPSDQLNVAGKIEIIGETTGNKCELCHHAYDEEKKKVIYKKDTENSCRACHKAKDEKNARSMKKVAHSACVGCHMKLAEKVKAEIMQQGRAELTEQDKKRFGPFECKGCHGEHKELTPDEIRQIPRLVRGQKDVMDLPTKPALESPSKTTTAVAPSLETTKFRMKDVAFNHKAHEPRTQFCGTCHHYSLEKCRTCHTWEGDLQKGGGITYQQAFHASDGKRSCAGCHGIAKQDKKCAGCHQRLTAQLPQSSCSVCHSGPSGGVAREVPPLPLATDKEKVPEKAQMKDLEKDYKPAEMPHMKIVNRLITISNESSLARQFHSFSQESLCLGCHHKSQPSAQIEKRWPKCASCHGNPFSQVNLAVPGLLNAYHQQCMVCHKAMEQKPAPLECDKCHAVKSPLQVITRTDIPLRGYGK